MNFHTRRLISAVDVVAASSNVYSHPTSWVPSNSMMYYSVIMRPLAGLAILVLSFLMITAVALGAKAQGHTPPTGRYDCVIGSDSILFGTITIKDKTHYTHRGTKGTYVIGKRKHWDFGANGYTMRFRKGDLDRMKGGWYHATDGTPKGTTEIALINPKSNFEDIYCDRRK